MCSFTVHGLLVGNNQRRRVWANPYPAGKGFKKPANPSPQEMDVATATVTFTVPVVGEGLL
jgi:hypothetical protein